MYPNQPQQPFQPTPEQTPPPAPQPAPQPMPTAIPSDYLNQIAPQAPKKPLFSFGPRQIALIGGGLVILVIILAIVVNTIVNAQRSPLEHLAASLTSTQTVVTGAQKNLKSSELRSLNTNLNLYLTNTNRDIATPLLSAGVDTAKLSSSVVAAESNTALLARLEDARLNAVYDRTYAREMAYQLGTIMNLMSQTYNSSNNSKVKAFLKSAYDNLKPTQASFQSFTTTN